MVTLMLHKNRFLRALALLGALALIVGVQSSARPQAAGSVATSITVAMTQTCGGGTASYTFSANGITIGTAQSTNTCTCDENVLHQTFAVPAGLSGLQPGAAFKLQQNGQSQITEAKITVNRPDGPESVCLLDRSGRNCATEDSEHCYSNAVTTGATFGPVIGDTDGDGVNNSADLDWDGDGVPNASDNCSLIANANQADVDGNGVGDACQMALVAVPWQGSETLSHQVITGTSITLQAAFSRLSDGETAPLTSATWDAGDGNGPLAVPVTDPRVIQRTVTYNGPVGQPFTATVRATDAAGNTYSDTFKVVIASNSRETKVNMAIDKALWNLHTRMVLGQSDGKPSGYWRNFGSANIIYVERVAATASSVQSLEINNHRESGDAMKDPYVTDVRRGLRFLLSLGQGGLQHIAISSQGGNNPDSNGNSYGLVVSQNLNSGQHQSYVSGQVVDAIVASGTPNKVADVGEATYVAGRTYHDIVQDLLDGYSFGMNDAQGGWNYNFNDGGGNDTSASHWWGIAVLAAQVWGIDAPSWVKSIQWNTGVPLMQIAPPQTLGCYFGYSNSYTSNWGDNQTNVTAAGLILMNADGIAHSNTRFTCAEKWLETKFNTTNSFGNYYTMYQTAKAMRTATDGAGHTTPITKLNGTIDWYAQYADYLLSVQDSTGAFISSQGSIGSYIKDDLATSWAVIILSPSLFEVPPTAACTATPATIGFNGGLVNFSAAASSHVDPTALPLTYAWNFGDAGTSTGVAASHTYAAHPEIPVNGSIVENATVVVTDIHGNSATASCPVTITRQNVPPSVSTSGPYTMCVGSTLTVFGTATDEDGTIASTAWDLDPSNGTNFNVIDATGTSVDVSARFNALGAGAYDIGFQATDNNGAKSGIFSTVTVLPANSPVCNQPPAIHMPPNQTIEATSPAGAVATFAATASDDHDTITPVCTPASGSTFGINTTTSKTTAVNCTATDTQGASASGTFNVTVQDTTAPVITVPADLTVHASGFNGANVNYAAATATDIVDVTDPVSCLPASGTLFPMGTTQVACLSTDQHHNSNVKFFNVTVNNAAPTAGDDFVTTHAAVTINVLANDTDPDGDALTVQIMQNTQHGTTVTNPDKTITYTPFLPLAFLSDSFTYKIDDGRGGTASAAVNISITNAPPSATPAFASTHGAPVTVNLSSNWSDADGDPITGPQPKIGPFNGNLAINPDGSVTYTPFNIFHNGNDTWTYTISDGHGGSTDGTLTINVHNVNPIAVNDAATTHGPVTISVLANDSDADNDALTISGAGGATHGSVTVNANQTVTYTPFLPLSFPTDSFTYSINDGHGGTATATVSVTLTNAIPVANNETVTLAHAATSITIPVLVNDTDADNDTLSINSMQGDANTHGTLTNNGNGTITYVAAPGFFGPGASFTYTANDGHGGISNIAVVTVQFTNAAPTAVNDAATTHVGVPVNINVLANDSDADHDAITVTGFFQGPPVNGGPSHGTVSINPDGTVRYSPNANFFGASDSFIYQVSDAFGGNSSALVTVAITNTPPVAVNDAATTHGPVTINVLGNDSDADGDPVTIQIVNFPQHGFASINPTNPQTVTYSPNTGQASNDTFSYTLNDGHGGISAPALVTITVTNAAPIANNDTLTLAHNVTTIAIPVMANDSDPDGDSITVQFAANGNNCHCSLAVNPDGTVQYTSIGGPAQFSSPAQFNYTIKDKYGAAATATVTVNFANQPPTAAPFFFTTHGQPITVSLLANAQDADGDTLSVVSTCGGFNNPAVGQCFGANGTLTFSPNPNWRGPQIQLGYTVSDGHSGIANSFVQIKYVNAVPQVVPHTFTTQANTAITLHEGDLLVGDTDADGDHLFVPNGVTISHGSLAPLPDGSDGGTFTPDLNFVGDAIITFVVDDGHGGQVNDTAVIHVVPAPSVTTISCTPSVVFNGAAQTACTAHVTGNGNLNQDVPVTYVSNTNVGTATASAVFPGDVAHVTSNASTTFEITKAATTTVVTCSDVVYNGAAQETCAANVTGAGGVNEPLTVSYANNTNVGTATGSATYAGDANHSASDSSATFQITPATTSTVVTCTPTVVFTGAAQELCTATVTGAGDFSQSLPVTYTNNTAVGTATGSASFAGDANHTASAGDATFQITKAPSVTVVTCPASLVYTGSALTPCTASVTGDGGLTAAVTPVTYTGNTNVGTANAAATYVGDANHDGSTGNATFAITQAATSTAINAPTIMVAANGTVTVTVTSGSGTVLGNVSLTVDGGAAVTQALTGGSSVFTIASPDAGDHALVATYAAQGDFAASTATGNLHVNPSPTSTTLAVSAAAQLSGTTVTFTATVAATAPGSGTPNSGTVTFKEGTTVLGAGTVTGGVATFSTTTLSNGPHTITAVYNGVNNYLTSTSNTVSKLIYGFATGGGTFVIGDNNATMGNTVNFWGSQWEKTNSLTGGASNASFKGFAMTPAVPTVGATFTSAPGNSVPQPSSVPQYIGIIVTSKVTKSGSNITGTITKLVVVRVDAGYVADPGHAGTGTIVAFIQ